MVYMYVHHAYLVPGEVRRGNPGTGVMDGYDGYVSTRNQTGAL